MSILRTKNEKRRTKNKEQRTKNEKQRTKNKERTKKASYKMKKLNLIVAVIIFIATISGTIFSQRYNIDWKLNSIDGNNLNDVAALNANVAIAVGNYGTIWKTTNAGTSWNLIPVDFTHNLNKVQFTSTNVLYIYGQITGSTNKILIKSTDQGATWPIQISDYTTMGSYDIKFYSDERGYRVNSGYFYRTTNSGTTWTSLANITVPYLNKLEMVDSSTIYLYSTSSTTYIARSTNGGTSWTYKTQLYNLISFQMIDSIGYGVTTTSKVVKTTNYGTSWTDVYYNTQLPLKRFSFLILLPDFS